MPQTGDLGANTNLIGVAGSRQRLITPALVLDLEAMERNIARAKAHTEASGVALRPHSKTHKCLTIARRQIEAGALGICCATLGEAEIMGRGGIGGVLITSPVVSEAKIEALMALNRDADGLMQVVDNMTNMAALGAAAAQAGLPLTVVVDVDAGLHRTGAATVADALALVEAAESAEHLRFAGLQGYAGHVQHIEGFEDRRKTSLAELELLRGVRDALVERGTPPPIVSGAGTGTHDIDPEAELLNELQLGSYVVMDVEYNDIECRGGKEWLFESALFVRATVVSANHHGSATIDAGFKCFATDGPKPKFAQGVPIGASYEYFGDEHGRIVFAQTNERLALGDALECVVPHCDPTINLYDVYHCVRGDTLVEIWPIEARGRH